MLIFNVPFFRMGLLGFRSGANQFGTFRYIDGLWFWNGDDTNLPGPMFCWYLRNAYLENKLREPGATVQCGQAVDFASVDVPTPVTWRLRVGEALPADLMFPLFVRTASSSWKLGGRISRVTSISQLESEASELRRAMVLAMDRKAIKRTIKAVKAAFKKLGAAKSE